MSKSRKHNKRSIKANVSSSAKKSRNWRKISRFVIFFGLFTTVVGAGLAAFKHQYDISHDLSVIGQGVPTVVQIHDPGCSLCNQLRRHASNAAGRFGDRILYRVADITTPQGRQLQLRYEVPHVTLLLFDGAGEMRRVMTGVKSDTTLERAFEIHLRRWGKTGRHDSPELK